MAGLDIFTAFAPAAVGGIHGINGFLDISGLAEQHENMAQYLSDIHNEMLSS